MGEKGRDCVHPKLGAVRPGNQPPLEDQMAFTVTRYRSSNPGQNYRGFDLTALDADTTTTITHNCLWTPDSWNLQGTDGTGCLYTGLWRAQVNATQAIVTKGVAAGSGGAVRLTLERLATRP